MPDGSRSAPAATRRPIWGYLVLLVAVAVQAFALTGTLRLFSAPSSGFMVVGLAAVGDAFEALPITAAAAEAATPAPGITRLAAINGVRPAELTRGAPLGPAIRGLMQVEPGATNRFLLGTGRGLREVSLPVAPASLGAWLRFPFAYAQLIGLAYLLAGWFVWWRRPQDRASLPLLAFTALTSVQLLSPAAPVWLDSPLTLLALALLPLYGTAGYELTLAFTGYHRHPRARVAGWLVMGVSVLLALGLVGSQWALLAGEFAWHRRLLILLMATGVHLVLSIVVMLGICWRASRPPHPLGLRRRAAAFGRAASIAFLVPSAYLVVAPLTGPWAQGAMNLVMPLLMGTFPVFIGYAIVRHRVFDLRIVVRQGVVYGVLSLGVTLGYLGVVLFGVRIVGRNAEQPLFIALIAGAIVLVASLLKLRLQRAVDRFVYRSRHLYAATVARASAELAQARSLDAVVDTMRVALIDSMQLSRAYVALGDGADNARLRVRALGAGPASRDGVVLPALPADLDAHRYAPIRRVLATGRVVVAYDSQAASAQAARERAGGVHAAAGAATGHGEDTFWGHFCIEQLVPLRIGDGVNPERIVGLLLLGPRSDERPFDREDERLLATLANQLAVALENARAFEEIERLKAGLEAEVAARTRELREALDTLGRAQTTLLESQKHALLGRLAAGIVHEVNSPLGALLSAADTLRRSVERACSQLAAAPSGGDGAEAALRALTATRELTTVIETASARIGALVTGLAAFVSLDQAEFRTVDLRPGLETAITMLGPQVGVGIVIERELGERPLLVRCSPARLNQVFLNLLENAVRAVTPRGTVRVEAEQTGSEILVTITDDGPGIPTEQLERVFGFSFTTKASGRIGLGLGLPASRRAVEELGGRLELSRVPSGGTRASVSLPIAREQASSPPPPMASAQ